MQAINPREHIIQLQTLASGDRPTHVYEQAMQTRSLNCVYFNYRAAQQVSGNPNTPNLILVAYPRHTAFARTYRQLDGTHIILVYDQLSVAHKRGSTLFKSYPYIIEIQPHQVESFYQRFKAAQHEHRKLKKVIYSHNRLSQTTLFKKHGITTAPLPPEMQARLKSEKEFRLAKIRERTPAKADRELCFKHVLAELDDIAQSQNPTERISALHTLDTITQSHIKKELHNHPKIMKWILDAMCNSPTKLEQNLAQKLYKKYANYYLKKALDLSPFYDIMTDQCKTKKSDWLIQCNGLDLLETVTQRATTTTERSVIDTLKKAIVTKYVTIALDEIKNPTSSALALTQLKKHGKRKITNTILWSILESHKAYKDNPTLWKPRFPKKQIPFKARSCTVTPIQ